MSTTSIGRLTLLITITMLAVPTIGRPASPTASLVVDLKTEETDGSSSPGPFVEMGDYAYFSANDGVHGNELWRSDGTESGTSLVADTCPGTCWGVKPWHMFSGDEGLFFFSHADNFGSPWYSDGTSGGTRPLHTRNNSATRYGAATNTNLFFFPGSAEFPDNGKELWVTTSDPGSARQVRDICGGECSSNPNGMTPLADLVLFTASIDTGARTLWVSDGSEGGTHMLAETGKLRLQDWLRHFVRFGDKLYFSEWEGYFSEWGGLGAGLWSSDGTPQGTARLFDLCDGTCTTGPDIWRAGDALFLVQSRDSGVQLWKSDGSAVGTNFLIGFSSSYLENFVQVGESVLFVRRTHDTVDLWTTDGSAVGTRLLLGGFEGIVGMTPVGGPGSLPWRAGGNGSSPLAYRRVVRRYRPDGGGDRA